MTKQSLPFLLILVLTSSACSVRRFAVNKIGDALAQGGSTYESDDDVELVRGALPFGLKLIESLLAESPRHKGLLLAASQGFTSYAFIDAQQTLDVIALTDLDAAERIKARVRRLYVRGHDYGMTALELSHPGFRQRMETEPRLAVKTLRKNEVPNRMDPGWYVPPASAATR